MKYLLLLLAAGVLLTTPACQTLQPRAKLVVEAPARLDQVTYKLEVTCD